MTKLIYWPPLPWRDRLHDRLERAIDETYKTPQTPPVLSPKIELQNAGTALILRAEVPGVDGSDLDVQVSRQSVLIAGKYRQKPMDSAISSRSEFRYGQFRRTVELPVAVQNHQLSAALKDGILTLTLPKASAARPTAVKINLAEGESLNPGTQTSRENLAPIDLGGTVAKSDPQLLEDVWGASEAA